MGGAKERSCGSPAGWPPEIRGNRRCGFTRQAVLLIETVRQLLSAIVQADRKETRGLESHQAVRSALDSVLQAHGK